jgi:hypothetical protein
MSAIVKGVGPAGAEDSLAAFTSHLDLMVVAQPIPETPYDLFAVRTPSEGGARIGHVTVTGRNDKLDRPADEAVALLWRFMIEKFGVRPGGSRPEHHHAVECPRRQPPEGEPEAVVFDRTSGVTTVRFGSECSHRRLGAPRSAPVA